ncbi:MAG: hypothetical protein KDI36_16605, partial [Pseudomonadales bacterium]|nr:hypothetical protein [Pseudomonadales bacterium]
ADILDGIRHGRIFVSTGDLISTADITVSGGSNTVTGIGETLVATGGEVTITVRVTDPAGTNHNGDSPALNRIDIIGGEIQGLLPGMPSYRNTTARVLKRFARSEFRQQGEQIEVSLRLANLSDNYYLRVRGTNSDEAEPAPDLPTENPWQDLWFYTNPVFVTVSEN